MSLAVGVKVSLLPVISVARTDSGNWPCVMATLLNFSVPASGRLEIVTDKRPLAGTSNGSLKPKSLVLNVLVVAWPMVMVVSLPRGASFTAPTATVIVAGVGSVSTPVFCTPPLSLTWNWNWAYVGPLALAAGTNLRLPPAICAAVTGSPAATPWPFKVSVPALGSVVIRMPLNWLAGVSCVSKLAAVKKSPVRNV